MQNNHFQRLYNNAAGTFTNSAEREYSRLMYLRAVLTWISRKMFKKRKRFAISNGKVRVKELSRTVSWFDGKASDYHEPEDFAYEPLPEVPIFKTIKRQLNNTA